MRQYGSICLLAVVAMACSAWAEGANLINVTAMEAGKEHRFSFKGCPFPYVLRLTESQIGKDTYRALGLRGPWFEDPFKWGGNAWYANGFMDISINGKPVIGGVNANKKYPLLFDRCEVLESGGERALVQYVWDREEALVRLRFLMRPESRALLAEIKIEPKQEIKIWGMGCAAYPGAFTSKQDGERRMKTAIREEKSVTNVQVNIQTEPWMLFYDQKYDSSDPKYGRLSPNGCAGFYLLPDGVATNTVSLTGYPAGVNITAQPGVTRLRFAFDELRTSYTNAIPMIQKEAPRVQAILSEDTFQPACLTSFDAEQERKKINSLGGTGCSCNRRIPLVKETLKKADEASTGYKLNSGTKPISGEQEALNALNVYSRRYLTAVRHADRKLRVFEMRGPGYGKYKVEKAVEMREKDKGEVDGGFLFVTGQGRGLSQFPGMLEKMYHYDVFLILDVDTRALSTKTLEMLRQYVEDGGGLIMSGGFFSYGASNVKDSPLAEMLPVVIEKAPFGLVKVPDESLLKVFKSSGCLRGVKWDDRLISPWTHELVPRKGAEVLVMNGDLPWLVSWKIGQGRVVACAGTLFGEASGGKIMFYEWEGWPEVMGKMIKWASGK